VVGKTIVRVLFNGDEQAAIGRQVNVAGEPFTVVGVMEERGATILQNADAQVIIPIQQFHQLLGGAEGQKIAMLLVKSPSSQPIQQTQDQVREILLALHGSDRDFNVATQEELSGTLGELTSTMDALLLGIAAIGLIQSAAAISIIMYISVQQRRREIGIRAAAGASPIVILSQFLTEGIVIALVGGIIGIPVGVLFITAINQLSPMPAVLVPYIVGLAFGAALIVGVVGSLLPAWLASKVEPVEAMRSEQ
jgi:putative ABC transport system permease protein